MCLKLNVKGGGKRGLVVPDGGILVHDLLLDEDYDKNLEKFHFKILLDHVYYDVRDIESTGFGFHVLF
jgi:hypothetical protein